IMFGPSCCRFCSTTTASADFCRPIPAPHGTGSTLAGRQISRGNSRDFPAYACRLYVTAFRVSIGLW
ncbi:hypothetical protein, partial [Escherichia coli]|uniref:hypothetical protein n=1 Tax=Escherichia coli TaxID=562 RepID=UPI001BFE305B